MHLYGDLEIDGKFNNLFPIGLIYLIKSFVTFSDVLSISRLSITLAVNSFVSTLFQ